MVGSRESPKMALSLSALCFQALRTHLAALGSQAVRDLPVPLLTELLPHLTVCQLDELQPALNLRGVSTYSGWFGILQECLGANNVVDLHTEEEAKHAVMRQFFQLVFYGFRNPYIDRNNTSLNTPAFLLTAAKCIQHFVLIPRIHGALQSLAGNRRALLNLLERSVRSIGITQYFDPMDGKKQIVLFILHRLLDHGVATKLVLHSPCPLGLGWLLHGRGTHTVSLDLRSLMHSGKGSAPSMASTGRSTGDKAAASDEQVIPCKRFRLDDQSGEGKERASFTEDLQGLCHSFSPCDHAPDGACPRGKITSLVMRQCDSDSLQVLNFALVTFFSLRSLILNSSAIFRESDVVDLAKALKQLSQSFHSSFCNLTITVLPNTRLIQILLDSFPSMTSLRVEVETVSWGVQTLLPRHQAADSDITVLSLQKLSITVAEPQTDLGLITSVLRRCPQLTCLHLAGMRLPSGSSQIPLLTALSVSNRSLTTLHLEDLKLSDCFTHILNLLKDCKLEELQLNDCRLLEASPDKWGRLQQLVTALKNVPSLHTLSLAQNRLAKNVCVLAELFSGSLPSFVKHLNISSNFIQAAELLDFAERLRKHQPPHLLTLDLRKNPGDRDPDTWNAALETLYPFSRAVVGGWKSTNTMLDHISNM